MTLKDSIKNNRLHEAKKRLIRALKAPEGKQALNEILGTNILWSAEAVGKRDRLPLVAILVPSYKGRMGQAWDGVEKMIQASRGVCRPFVEPRYCTSVVHWTRNWSLAKLLETQKPFDYVLFLDDDIIPPPDALLKLLAHKKDFVGAACTVRNDPPVPNLRLFGSADMLYRTNFIWKKNELIGGLEHAVGAGMILLSLNCLERVGEYYINCAYERKYYGLAGEALDKLQTGRQETVNKTLDFWWFEFLKHPLGQGEYSEDLSFCFKCRELGIPVFIDTSIQPGHLGDYAFSLSDYEGTCQQSIIEDAVQQGDILGIPQVGRESQPASLLDAPMQLV